MRLAMTMTLTLTLTTLLAGSGCGTKSCKDGTLLIDLSFSGASASATTLQIDVATNGQTRTATTTHAAGAAGTLEVDFAGGYPTGATATVTVTAISGGAPVGAGTGTTTLGGKCATLEISVGDIAGAGSDMAMPPVDDLSSGADLAAPPDLTVGPDMATCVLSASPALIWVDSTNGVNDTAHGNQAGCPVKTITYALTRAGAATQFNLAPGTTYTTAVGETFPISMIGTQTINGDPNNTGTRATIQGGADCAGNGAPICITGTNNTVRNLVITGLGGTSTNVCVNVNSVGAAPAGHVIDNCDIHDCGGTNSGTGVAAVNGNNANVSNSTIHNALNGVNFFGNTGTVKKNTFTTLSGNGIFCAAADPGVTGCGASYGAGVTTQCSGCANCATFTAACP